jgi:hypothetical protein
MLMRMRRLGKDREGQAIVLAAIGLLVLAIGVLATVNLGHAIHERIRLQNTADAGAYSVAATEARAFNFFAFTNRAQVSHYVTVMSLQSWLTMLWFIDAFLGTLADALSWASVVFCACCLAVVTSVVCCPVEAVVKPAYTAVNAAYEGYRTFAEMADRVLGNIVYHLPKVNRYGVFITQKMMKELARINVWASGRDLVYENDPDIDLGVWNVASLALNQMAFNPVFDTSSENLPKPNASTSSDEIKAMRVMTEVSNATRYPDFVTNRSLSNMLNNIPGVGGVLSAVFNLLPVSIEPTGQTKLGTHREKCNMNISCCCRSWFGTQWDYTQLAKGNSVIGDEVLSIRFGWGDFSRSIDALPDVVSVVAMVENRGEHCQHDRKKFNTLLCGDFHLPKPKCMGDSNNHKWDGIMPYIKFQPDSDPEKDFNQPSAYVFLNKKPEKLGGSVYEQHFTFDTTHGRAEKIDTRLSKADALLDPVIPKGLNAWARGMAYYHRPSTQLGGSNWKEYPNFFNPFWRAKLAPLGEKVEQLLAKVPLAGSLGNAVVKQILTH